MGNIVLLDEHTINKIAAGEVVDRPASIVKELIENSIDAKATNITVEIKNGGISYIKIVDNGTGIASDDVEIAFERHATSKIRQEDDLRKITSMGFRGEALASVAAISKVNMITKRKDEPVGTKIQVEAGKIISVEQVASTQGTTIQIHDVFYNVPARYKFLKKDYTEAGYIEDVVTRIAMSNPSISFKYINNGKVLIQTTGDSDVKTVIYNIFGKEIYQSVIDVNYDYQGMTVEGVIGLPKIARSTRIQQFTYINSRYIKDKTITAAIDKAYAQQLEINKFAFAVLNIKMNPENIDVNVHPAKLEVKFSNETEVFEAVYYAIKSSLENHNRQNSPFTTMGGSEISNEPNKEIRKIIEEKRFNNYEYKPSVISNPKIEQKSINQQIFVESVDNFTPKSETIYEKTESVIKPLEIIKAMVSESVIEQSTYTTQEIKNEEQSEIKDPYKYIGCVFDTYIIIQIRDKMYIIDQHAAHERLLFEQIKENYYSKDRQTQMLLLPILVDVTSKEKNIVNENEEMFRKIGYVIEDFGDNAIKISGVPNVGYDIDYKSMFTDTIDELMGASRTNTQDKEFRFLATVACKAAVKANMKLTETEHKALIEDMMKLERPFTCPHGRPTAYEITKNDIEKRFLRK